MGQKVNPIGLRLGIIKTWESQWYGGKNYAGYIFEDHKLRKFIKQKLYHAGVSRIEIERSAKRIRLRIYTARPGIVIGKGGANVEALRQQIGRLTTRKVKLEIKEIRQPELDAYLVALNIAQQPTRRVAYKKAMKQSIQRSMKAGAKGVKSIVRARVAFRGGKAGDVDYKGGAIQWSESWEKWRTPPTRFAIIYVTGR